MTHTLLWLFLPKWPLNRLIIGIIFCIALLGYARVSAQQVETQPLTTTSVCAGSTIDVTGVRTLNGTTFTIELSNGGSYYEIPSTFLSSSGRYEITYRATIPASTSAGNTYQIRIVSKSPDIAGTPSPTHLTVKAKPVTPSVEAIQLDCQRRTANDAFTTIYLKILSGASAKIYDATSRLLQNGNQLSLDSTTVYFLFSKSVASTDNGFVYPVSETKYYVSQVVNGCESDLAPTLSRLLYRPGGGPTPVNQFAAGFGKITYCQGDKAVPLNVNGHSAPPENYLTVYSLDGSNSISTTTPPIPDTSVPGSQTYKLGLVPIDAKKGCASPTNATGPFLKVDVNPRPSKPIISVSSVTLCQLQATSPLSATVTDAGGVLVWYGTNATGGTSSTVAAQPSIAKAGTFSYYVAQKVNDCESERVEVKVIVKPTPAAPGTSAITVCQNEAATVLLANGQNLLWYTTGTGSTGASTAPTLSTSQPGQTTYFVSQSIDGCEGPRAALLATVNLSPAAPVVSQKNLCQFSPSERMLAVGNGLRWYTPDGSKLDAAPLINTDNVASFTALVTQTTNGCEGPKAIVLVNVQPAPVPTVSKTSIEVCRGTSLQPLDATGTNLKWTDPAGNVTATAPVPPTITATSKPEGDAYYVTQTGANGCESPRVAIHVFVQTTPTMSILGTTITNLGVEVPLKLTFTGVGPYRFKLLNSLIGSSIKDTTILVLPDHTTTYQVVEVANKCGTVLSGTGGSVTVTVMIPTIQTLPLLSATLCAGASLITNFATTGTFNPGSNFKVQLAKAETDSTKINFVDMAGSQGANGQITSTIPGNMAGGLYWVRVIATNPKIPIKGNNSPTPLVIQQVATATLTGNQTIFEGQSAQLSVTFSGDGPWKFAYRDSTATGLGSILTISTQANPYGFQLRPTKSTAYLLTGVSNGCGNGTVLRRLAVVTLIPLLGIDDQSLTSDVEVYPIPATTTLTIQIGGVSSSQPALLELSDLTGRLISQQETRQTISSLTLDGYPTGTYIMHIKVGDKTTSKRIVKY